MDIAELIRIVSQEEEVIDESVGLYWLRQQSSIEQAWNDCDNATWMLWLIYKMELQIHDKRKWISCKVEIAQWVIDQGWDMTDKSARAFETAKRYAKGEATEKELCDEYMESAYHGDDGGHGDYFAAFAVRLSWSCDDVRHKYINTQGRASISCADIVRKYYAVDDIIKAMQ